MASSPQRMQSDDRAAHIAAIADKRPVAPSRAYVVPDGRLPVSELALDRPGAGSPFGDDLSLPLPAERLTYTHPTEDAAPAPH
jgi:hypothetical protein